MNSTMFLNKLFIVTKNISIFRGNVSIKLAIILFK